MNVPSLDSKQMAELDRAMIEEYGIELEMMMENAGRALALRVRESLGNLRGKRVLSMIGKGNNGGGGLVASRHLHNWGARVELILAGETGRLRGVAMTQLKIVKALNIKVHPTPIVKMTDFDLIIDALLGYGQRGDPKGKVAELVRGANSSGRPIISLDIPTGLDPDTGRANDPCIRAIETLTLALPKRGLLRDESARYAGRILLADISVPPELYRRFGLRDPPFLHGPIVEL